MGRCDAELPHRALVYCDDANEAAHEQRKHNMNTACTLTRIIVGALIAGGAAVAGLGLSAGIAQADSTAHQWWPGKRMPDDGTGHPTQTTAGGYSP